MKRNSRGRHDPAVMMTGSISERRIRPIALGLIWNHGALLVEHGFDSVKQQHFFRPPGGAIEFGERAVDAVRREFLEELHAELVEPRLVAVLENLFQYEGRPGHELVFVFEARFKDSGFYERSKLTIRERNASATASWKSLAELAAGGNPVYPEGLFELLSRRATDSRQSSNREIRRPDIALEFI